MHRFAWILAALAGLVLTAGVTYAASRLSTQRVGLSSEPISAGRSLAPSATPAPRRTATPASRRKRARKRTRVRATPTALPTAVPTAAPTAGPTTEAGDDHGGGSRRGRGRGGGGNDD